MRSVQPFGVTGGDHGDGSYSLRNGGEGCGLAVTERRLTVLVADDVAQLRRIVRRILDRDGRFEVVAEASDGVEAVDLARVLQPDIAILDLMMPRKDGYQALREIRTLSSRTKVVVFSALGDEAMSRVDADAWLAKGEPAAAIIDCLEQFLD